MSLRHPLTALSLATFAAGSLLVTPLSVASAAPEGEALLPPHQAPPPPPMPHPRGTELSFTVSDEAQATADTLIIHLSAKAENATPSSAQQQLNQRVNAAMKLLNAQSAIKSTADNYMVGEEYGPHNKHSWVAQQSLTLSSQDREQLLAMTEKLQQLGLSIESMQWTLNPQLRETLEQQARLGALKKLRQQAENDATALGLSLVRLERVHIGGQGPINPLEPRPPMLMMAEMRSAATPPSSTAEVQTIRVTIHAQALLADKLEKNTPPTP